MPSSSPVRYIALLRAINVGGHVVKMAELRTLFEAMRFGRVKTFIASGNVLFDARAQDPAALERKIEQHLEKALGYEVATFIRTPAALRAAATHRGFLEPHEPGHARHVVFLKSELPPATRNDVLALSSDYDHFTVNGRELYWSCRGRFSDSKITPARFERALRMPATARNINTVQKLAALGG
jgi:uncharacterized protein (DUF1697 family)